MSLQASEQPHNLRRRSSTPTRYPTTDSKKNRHFPTNQDAQTHPSFRRCSDHGFLVLRWASSGLRFGRHRSAKQVSDRRRESSVESACADVKLPAENLVARGTELENEDQLHESMNQTTHTMQVASFWIDRLPPPSRSRDTTDHSRARIQDVRGVCWPAVHVSSVPDKCRVFGQTIRYNDEVGLSVRGASGNTFSTFFST